MQLVTVLEFTWRGDGIQGFKPLGKVETVCDHGGDDSGLSFPAELAIDGFEERKERGATGKYRSYYIVVHF